MKHCIYKPIVQRSLLIHVLRPTPRSTHLAFMYWTSQVQYIYITFIIVLGNHTNTHTAYIPRCHQTLCLLTNNNEKKKVWHNFEKRTKLKSDFHLSCTNFDWVINEIKLKWRRLKLTIRLHFDTAHISPGFSTVKLMWRMSQLERWWWFHCITPAPERSFAPAKAMLKHIKTKHNNNKGTVNWVYQ